MNSFTSIKVNTFAEGYFTALETACPNMYHNERCSMTIEAVTERFRSQEYIYDVLRINRKYEAMKQEV